MHLVRPLISRPNRSRSAQGRRVDRFVARHAVLHGKALAAVLKEPLPDRPFVEVAHRAPPGNRRQPFRALDGQVLVVVGYRKEASVADEARIAEHRLDVIWQFCKHGVVVGRANDAGMQRTLRAKIMDKPESAGHAPAHVEWLELF